MNKLIRNRECCLLPRPLKWWAPNVTGRVPLGRFFDVYAYLEGNVTSRQDLLFNLVHDQVYRAATTRRQVQSSFTADADRYCMSGRLFKSLTKSNSSEEWEAIVYGYMKHVQDCRTILRRHRGEWSKMLGRAISGLTANDAQDLTVQETRLDDLICRCFHEDQRFRCIIRTLYVRFLVKHATELYPNRIDGKSESGIDGSTLPSATLLLDAFVYPWLVYALLLESQCMEGTVRKGIFQEGRLRKESTWKEGRPRNERAVRGAISASTAASSTDNGRAVTRHGCPYF